jgi:uncharacterized pyridoxamine 5'-phosphate oxidase family protein
MFGKVNNRRFNMERVLKFLKDCGVFYVATVDNDQARVRPFGIAINLDGKLSIATSNKKDVFKQMKSNPKIEISATGKEDFIRISGEVFVNTNDKNREVFFEAMPELRSMYGGKENEFEVISFKKATATFLSLGTEKEVVEL